MAGELMTTLTSLGGVALGGGLSYLVQNNTQRMSARIEQRKQDVTRTENRRAERLTHLEWFIAAAVHSIARVYHQRVNRAVWDGVPDLEDLYPELDRLRDAFLAAASSALR
jgi:hypothetical protein